MDDDISYLCFVWKAENDARSMQRSVTKYFPITVLNLRTGTVFFVLQIILLHKEADTCHCLWMKDSRMKMYLHSEEARFPVESPWVTAG